MLNSRRVIHAIRAASFTRIAPQDFLSRLCIDLTCKSSFVSGVNAPLPSNTLFFRGILPDRVLYCRMKRVDGCTLALALVDACSGALFQGRNAHIRSSILHYVRKSHDWKKLSETCTNPEGRFLAQKCSVILPNRFLKLWPCLAWESSSLTV